MRKILSILFLVGLLSAPVFCQQSIAFAWDPHEESSTITGFHLWQSKTPGGPYEQVGTFIPGTLTSGEIPKPGLGRYCWVLTAYVPDAESDNSNEVCTVLKPKPPKLISVIQRIASIPVKAGKTVAGVFARNNGRKLKVRQL